MKEPPTLVLRIGGRFGRGGGVLVERVAPIRIMWLGSKFAPTSGPIASRNRISVTAEAFLRRLEASTGLDRVLPSSNDLGAIHRPGLLREGGA